MSGPGIYTFRVHNAEQLYPMFQRYINAVNTDAFVQGERERVNSNHSVSANMGRTEGNNYLEPAPLMSRQLGNFHSEHSSANPSYTLQANDSQVDDSPPHLQSPVLIPSAYLDQPLRALPDCCLEGNSTDLLATPPSGNRLSMRRRTLDLPPLESAPAPAPVLSLIFRCFIYLKYVFFTSPFCENKLAVPQLTVAFTSARRGEKS